MRMSYAMPNDLPEHPEYEGRLAEFEARIQAGEKIEPDDWMPAKFRRQMIRLIQQHANSELIGALPEGTWIPYAPSLKRKMALTAKVQDEVGHAQLLYRAAETLGKPREEMVDELINGKSKWSNVFAYPAETWADVAVIAWLIDAAAIVNQKIMANGSYGPYCRALKRICFEESFHMKHGEDMIVTLMEGTPEQREQVQDALNRWYWPIIMFFGPHDKDSVHTVQLKKWGVKPKTNDQQRQEFLRKYMPRIYELGLTVPDPDMHYDAQQHEWVHGEAPWDEFYQVIRGNGPMSKERLATRRLAYDEGKWVRDALAMMQRMPQRSFA
ncbi:MAG: 1,2-phenylacetyl-CoA epoxidase subunit PaaA [Ardenticatenaceae bacterium]